MFPAGFEPRIPASEWPQTHARDRATTAIKIKEYLEKNLLYINKKFVLRTGAHSFALKWQFFKKQ